MEGAARTGLSPAPVTACGRGSRSRRRSGPLARACRRLRTRPAFGAVPWTRPRTSLVPSGTFCCVGFRSRRLRSWLLAPLAPPPPRAGPPPCPSAPLASGAGVLVSASPGGVRGASPAEVRDGGGRSRGWVGAPLTPGALYLSRCPLRVRAGALRGPQRNAPDGSERLASGNRDLGKGRGRRPGLLQRWLRSVAPRGPLLPGLPGPQQQRLPRFFLPDPRRSPRDPPSPRRRTRPGLSAGRLGSLSPPPEAVF